MSDSENEDNFTTSQAVEDIYQKKTQLEHILLRPDTYIGSVEKANQEMWIVNENGKLLKQTVSFVPGLYKIFDEILVNAADNAQRDKNMREIRVDIDVKENKISVKNDGRGIPIEKHKVENVWVPELIFGHLLTSSNFNDDQKKTTGGRNGYGAKLANVFSNKFIVETLDSNTKKKYSQIFRSNMSLKEEPLITKLSKCKISDDYTKITFYPDLQKFGMHLLDEDIVGLMRKRAYDMAGTVKKVDVYLNGDKIKIKDFKGYVQLYAEALKDENNLENIPKILFDSQPNWEIALLPSNGQFQHCAFVNNISTFKGGAHINKTADKFADYISEFIKKKHKNLRALKNFQIKNQMFLFVNCLIQNPAFDSQTKECLTTVQSKFGSKYDPDESFLKKIISCEIVDQILEFAKVKADKQLKKTDGSKRSVITGIPKLDDANNAGTKLAKNCVLILTEGDSAKSLAVCGLSVVGRDNYGCFPLRGKLLNVRDANASQVSNNSEIQNLKKILGLQQNKKYDSVDSLRYGSVMIMSDQDNDGSHIKGLIINFFDTYWPSLLKLNGFLKEFVTPIIKITHNRTKEEICFFTLPEYDTWKSENENGKGWTIKYYKGLGTSTAADAKKYFQNLQIHQKPFLPMTDEDRECITLAFSKKKADERKVWLANFIPGTYLDHSRKHLAISEFINKELILFSMADNIRSIPSVVDGLKPGQRKVLYSCFKRNLKSEIKVAQLSGYISEHTSYHHGEQSLNQTIVNLAQDYVGSNNINLLQPIGQFGTRLAGGKDSASARYIFTMLSNITRIVFNSNDDELLNYLNEDGDDIEPEYYMPVVPMVLINGSSGIGTGWSSSIPNYNPVDIVNNLKSMMNGFEPEEMHPFFRNFNGKIQVLGDKKYKFSGIFERDGDRCIHVKELPIGFWTQNFKELLEQLMVKDEKKKSEIIVHDYKEYHTEEVVSFVVNLTDYGVNLFRSDDEIEKKLKLSTSISATNLVCFDPQGKIMKYDTVGDILKEFYNLRLSYYRKRKVAMLKNISQDLDIISQKARFIQLMIDDTLIIKNKKKDTIFNELELLGFKRMEDIKNCSDENLGSYNYLLSMPISSFTKEKIDTLLSEKSGKETELSELQGKTIEDLWNYDLDKFLEELQNKETAAILEKQRDNRKKTKGKSKVISSQKTIEKSEISFFKSSNLKKDSQSKLTSHFQTSAPVDIAERIRLRLESQKIKSKKD
eukprot:NODE_54_length_30443_cov_1.442954.p1 type:complete len:1216 gc:universal NODE_54_length_30443_cov_1.442954:23418-27065(+)